MVWERLDCSGGELILALALADIGGDDGDRIYPSIGYLAYKTRHSERQIQRHLKKLRKLGWLQCKKVSKGGRSQTTRYRINPAWIKGDILSGFKDREPRHSGPETVTSMTLNPDMGVTRSVLIHPEPQKPRANPTGSRPAKPRPEAPAQTFAERERDYLALLQLRRETEAQQKKVKQ
jgi:hypothetical protein